MDFLNSDFLKLATILLAIIAIVALFLHHKPQGQSTRTIHIWYICGVATFVLIELITWICVGNPDASQIMLTVLIKAIFDIIENRKYKGNTGIYHYSNEGVF